MLVENGGMWRCRGRPSWARFLDSRLALAFEIKRVFLQDSRIILLRIEELEKELKETSGPLVTPSGDRRCEIYQLSSLDVLGWVSRVLGQTIHESVLEYCFIL